MSLIDRIYLYIFAIFKDNAIFTHLTLAEKILLHKILRRQKKTMTCVEIGSFLGASACFICNAITKDSKLYCIDTWGNHSMKYDENDTETERDTYAEFELNTQKYAKKIIMVRAWSSEAIHIIKKQTDKIDFLFIDGDHNYDGVKADWDLYSPLLASGAMVAFHDTGWAEGVRKVIADNVHPAGKLVVKLPNLEIYRMS